MSHKHCDKCGAREDEYMACEEPDCGKLIPENETANQLRESSAEVGSWPIMEKAANEIERLAAELEQVRAKLLKALTRNGKCFDEGGCCRVCDGEIPDGHTDTCDLYKLEQCAESAEAKNASLVAQMESLIPIGWIQEMHHGGFLFSAGDLNPKEVHDNGMPCHRVYKLPANFPAEAEKMLRLVEAVKRIEKRWAYSGMGSGDEYLMDDLCQAYRNLRED